MSVRPAAKRRTWCLVRKCWISVLEFLRRHVALIAVALLLAYAAWISYLMLAQPQFTATAKVLVDPRQAALLSREQPLSVIDTDEVPSQVNLLNSDAIARKVISQLDLTRSPEFSQPGLLSRLASVGLPAQVTDIVPRQLSELMQPSLTWLASEMERRSHPQLDSGEQALQRTLRAFHRHLKVKPVPSSHVIDVSFSSPDPKRAALIANTTAAALIELELNSRSANTEQANNWSRTALARFTDSDRRGAKGAC